MIALISVGEAGARARDRLAAVWPGRTRVYEGPVREAVQRAADACGRLVVFAPPEEAVRLTVALLARGSTGAPAPELVCVDPSGRFVIPLSGIGGLGDAVGSALGAQAVPGAGAQAPGGDQGLDAAPGPLVVGVGARRGVAASTVLRLVEETVAEAGYTRDAVARLTTVDAKSAEPGLLAAARDLGVPLVPRPAALLAGLPVAGRSQAAYEATGTPSVAEAAALAGGGRLLVPKRKSADGSATCAVAVTEAAREDDTGGRGGLGERRPAGPDGTAARPAPDAHDLRHHGDAEVRRTELTDLAVNVRTGTPPAWLRERIAGSLGTLAAYPDGRDARAAVAARHGLPPERVLLTAGAAEAFVLLARALRPRRAVVVHPQFTEPEAALRDAGHPVDRVLLDPADGFRLDPAAVPEDADLVVVGNPTNPTSVLHPAAALAALARPGRTLVVDEAFMDAVPDEREALAGVTDVPGLVVLRSLTKTWGLAGLRIGYVLAEPDLLACLVRAQPLWPVSSPALAAAQACVSPTALREAEQAARRTAADRDHLLAGLGESGVFAVTPAEGPFVLIRLPGAAQVRERLRGAGFAVRRGDTFPGLGPDWLRLAVRDRATTDRFVDALNHALNRAWTKQS